MTATLLLVVPNNRSSPAEPPIRTRCVGERRRRLLRRLRRRHLRLRRRADVDHRPRQLLHRLRRHRGRLHVLAVQAAAEGPQRATSGHVRSGQRQGTSKAGCWGHSAGSMRSRCTECMTCSRGLAVFQGAHPHPATYHLFCRLSESSVCPARKSDADVALLTEQGTDASLSARTPGAAGYAPGACTGRGRCQARLVPDGHWQNTVVSPW